MVKRKYARRFFLHGLAKTFVFASLFKSSHAFKAKNDVIILGAIRWDAWYDPEGQVGKAVEMTLGPSEFHSRMPFFGKEVSREEVVINGKSQQIFDKEINYASNAGLHYWAYCWFGKGSEMQNAWNLHQSSKLRERINWCMLWTLSNMGGSSGFERFSSDFITFFSQPFYQKVLNSRPIVYIFIDNIQHLKSAWQGSWANVGQSLSNLRAKCVGSGLGAPYIVVMYADARIASMIKSQIGGDAISSYILPIPKGKKLPYAALADEARRFTERMSATKSEIVPLAMTGWNTLPRKVSPPFFQRNANAQRKDDFIISGTPQQIVTSIIAQAIYVLRNKDSCPSRLLIIYSWDECDEGGTPLIPTFKPDGADDTLVRVLGQNLKRLYEEPDPYILRKTSPE